MYDGGVIARIRSCLFLRLCPKVNKGGWRCSGILGQKLLYLYWRYGGRLDTPCAISYFHMKCCTKKDRRCLMVSDHSKRKSVLIVLGVQHARTDVEVWYSCMQDSNKFTSRDSSHPICRASTILAVLCERRWSSWIVHCWLHGRPSLRLSEQ